LSSPYGYWEFGGRNGLEGGASTHELLEDGRVVTVKDPDFPAILEDPFILYALSHVRQARFDFCRLFPTLDVASQERLAELIVRNKRDTALVRDDQDFADAIQLKQVTAGVRIKLQRVIR